MKWMVSTSLIIMLALWVMPTTQGSYQNYENITMIDGDLLADFDDETYQQALKKVEKRKFYGWRI